MRPPGAKHARSGKSPSELPAPHAAPNTPMPASPSEAAGEALVLSHWLETSRSISADAPLSDAKS
jgi:hypothetical protein